MSVRWQHCIYHADKHSKAGTLTRLSSRRNSAADRQSVKEATLNEAGRGSSGTRGCVARRAVGSTFASSGTGVDRRDRGSPKDKRLQRAYT